MAPIDTRVEPAPRRHCLQVGYQGSSDPALATKLEGDTVPHTSSAVALRPPRHGGTNVTTRINRRPIFAAVLGLTLSAIGGCSNDPTPEPSASVSSAGAMVSATANAVEEQARQEVLAAYNGYLEAYVKASATADYNTQELAKFVGEPLLGQLLNNLFNMSRSGVHNDGRPTWSPTVTELRLDSNEAVVQDCFDSTNWNAVGGKVQPTTQAKKYPVVVKVKRVNGKWYVYESAAQRGSTC
jgi:type II secretory pathway pseudopilin PulG